MEMIGIDYGSKLAGTTVIAWIKNNTLAFAKSEKKKDADRFIIDFLSEKNTTTIFIDAPLSLPSAYFGNGDDYFYRECDRQLKGMSPMFLGGLTARAIKLKTILEKQKHELLEVYPGALSREWDLKDLGYKKEVANIPVVANFLKQKLPYSFNTADIKTWHHLDALLAFIIGHRFKNKKSKSYGNKSEGQIIV